MRFEEFVMELPHIYSRVRRLLGAVRKFVTGQLEPALVVGDKKRARGKGEQDPDEERRANLNKIWRAMFLDDPWKKKLMSHVRVLRCAMGIFFLMYLFSGLYLPARHPIGGYISLGVLAVIPYWCWAGKWNRKIVEKVFEEFRKRFGEHFHLG
jgi:hypothetical protein